MLHRLLPNGALNAIQERLAARARPWIAAPAVGAMVSARRPELDALRVIAFGLLILYHVGMLYTANWGFHYKSAYRSETLESVMVLVNVWRMPLLWWISGVALQAALSRLSAREVLIGRSQRLLMPLLVGVWIIVPPQLYAEMHQAGRIDMDYLSFYRHFLDLDDPLFAQYQPGIWPHVDVNHLWYLRELWTFSLILLVLHPWLRTSGIQTLAARFFAAGSWPRRILLPALVLAVVLVATRMDREVQGFVFLVYGYLTGPLPGFWRDVHSTRKPLVLTALSLLLGVVVLYQLVWTQPDLRDATHWQLIGAVLLAFSSWTCVQALVALAQNRFRCDRPLWRYLQEAVLPYYVLHQSALVVAAMWLAPYALGPILEPLTVIAITVLVCGVSFELIRRVALLRLLFGLRVPGAAQTSRGHRLGRAVLGVVLLGFGLEILC